MSFYLQSALYRVAVETLMMNLRKPAWLAWLLLGLMVFAEIAYSANNPVPTTTSISPSVKYVGDASFTLTVNGTNFVASSTVKVNGSSANLSTTYVNSGQLTVTIPSSYTAAVGTYSVTVFNPTPGGGTSNAQTFTVSNPVVVLSKVPSTYSALLNDVVSFTITATNPATSATLSNVTITDVLPTGMTYQTNAATLGSVYVNGTTVTWTIPSLPASGSGQLTLVVSLTQQGSLTNTVTSPGATSQSATIRVLSTPKTHYAMDETAGTWNGTTGEVIDSGGTGLNATRLATSTPTATNTVVPNPTIASLYPSVQGGFCNAGSFDGNAVVASPHDARYGYTTQFSATTWIYPTSYPTGSNLRSILSNDQNYEFHLDNNGHLYWWWGGTPRQLTSNAVIPLNTWAHVAITFNSATGQGRQYIYINGVLDSATNNWTGTLTQNPCDFYVGGDISTVTGSCPLLSARNFIGKIDEPKLYAAELSQADVQADMILGRSCASSSYDHIQIEHDGTGTICSPETVIVKACMDSGCTHLYPGNVTLTQTPAGWVGGDTFTLTGGAASRQISKGTVGSITLGATSMSPGPANGVTCLNTISQAASCTLNFASASCAFDAVEVTAAPFTNIYTKLAGTFSLDVLALSGKSINTTYTGTVAVCLVETCPATNCNNALTTAQNITYATANAGRKTVSFTYPNADKSVRVMMQVGSNTAACSTDNFAIRPSVATLTATETMATPELATATPTLKAGSTFHLTASTTPTNYTGTLTLDTSKLSAHGGGGVGGLTPSSLTANATAAAATYSEVGYVYLAAGVYRDDLFTSVDSSKGDCITDTTSNNYLSTTPIGGKYGCSIGNTPLPLALGRFIPDHFALSPGVATPACSGSFTYFGQDGFSTPFTLTAQNLTNATTLNYTGTFAKLVLTSWSDTTAATGLRFSAVLPTGSILSASATAPTGVWGNGQASVTAKHQVSRPTALTGETLVTVNAAPIDSDGVTTASTTAVQTTGTPLRYGRLSLFNAFGSENSTLAMPVQTQYWDGFGLWWVLNSADSCTTIPTNSLYLTYSGTGGTPVATGTTLTAGQGNIAFNPPSPTGTGSVDVAVNLGASGVDQSCLPTHGGTASNQAWLRSQNGSCATTYDRDPSARASFGIYAPETTKSIHVRELY